MTLLGVYGDVGSGKNIITTWDCLNTPKDIPIYSNFELKIQKCETIEPEEVFEVFEEDNKVPAKKMITDEAYTWFESRGSGTSEINKFLSYLMFQSRKRGLNWYSLAQIRATLDLRWRGMEDKVLYCHERNLDITGNSFDNFNYTLIKGFKVSNFTIQYKDATRLFNLYDTKKVLMPPEFKDLQIRMKNKNPENLTKYIDEIVEKIFKKYNKEFPKKELRSGEYKFCITQEYIRDLLLREGISPEHSSYVKVRIQNKLCE